VIASTFRGLRHRNFRLWFFGQLTSLVGTWMQTIAQNWLVYELTGSARDLGIVNFVGAVPLVPLTLYAGAIVDRFEKRKVIFWCQAAMMALAPPPLGVDLLFVDGEDYGPSVEDMFLGARRYAARIDASDRPVYGLLLDLVGDADPRFEIEELSAQAAPVVVRKVWEAAERLGYAQYFPNTVGARVIDDHVILIDAGLPTANLIDFVYGPNNRYWHTPEDTPENVSAFTLGMVGEVVAELVYSGG